MSSAARTGFVIAALLTPMALIAQRPAGGWPQHSRERPLPTVQTKDTFGDAELHVEWASPMPAEGKDQDRGNSGVFLMGTYEVQVLDSYGNATYADGSAASIYGQFPPRVNASRAPHRIIRPFLVPAIAPRPQATAPYAIVFPIHSPT